VGVFKDVFDWYPTSSSAEERKLLFKLDLSILIFACCCFFTKFLDQTNISNAYVSGMKEDLSLYGNQLNYFNVYYYTAYVIGQIPMLLILSRPKITRCALPTLEVIWRVLTFCQSRVTNVQQLYALRFLVGLAEAPVFAGTHFILGSWYRRSELYKRAGTWFLCNALGTMFSGYLQAAAYTNLDGVGGLAGWRWLFIIDGIITVPIAVAGFFVFPGLPQSPKPFQFNEKEIALAKHRMKEEKVVPPGKISLSVFKRTFSRWHIYVFVGAYICMIIASYPWSYMNLWLKAEKFSVPQINKLPTGISGIQIVSSWLGTTLATIFPLNAIYAIPMSSAVFSTICLTIWNIPKPLKFVAWYLFGLSGCSSPILYSTANTYMKGDAEERALVISTMMTVGYSCAIWVPLFLYKTTDAPQWKVGWPASLGFVAGLWFFFILATILHRFDEKKALSIDLESVSTLDSNADIAGTEGDKPYKEKGLANFTVKTL